MSRAKPFSKLNRSLVLTASLLAFISATAQTAVAQDELTRLEVRWKQRDYARVLPELLAYRERTGNKSLGLDYMIATSACRTADHRGTGSEFFSWMLYNYNLSGSNRSLVERERQKCSTNAKPESLGVIVPASLVGVSYSGKGGTGLRATSSGNSTARLIAEIPAETFAARLFEPSEWKTAASGVATLLGTDRKVEHSGSFVLVGPSKRIIGDPPASPDTSLPNSLGPPRTEPLNRARDANVSPMPNRRAIPNEATTPNAAARPSKPIELDQQDDKEPRNAPPNAAQPAPPPANASKERNAGVKPTGVDPNGIAPAGVNTSGGDPTNVNQTNVNPASVNPAGVNTPNVASPANVRVVPPSEVASPNQLGPRLNVQQRAPAGQISQHTSPGDSSGADEAYLKRVGGELERYSRFFVSEYGMREPSRLITVYFARDVSELRSLAGTLHGISLAYGSIGYSFPADQSMVGWADGQAYGTFAHELFHLMVRRSFGDIPPWLDEGMAALYEVSGFDGARAVGAPNWRGEILRDLWASRPHLRALVQMNRSAFDSVQDRSDKTRGGDTLEAGEHQAVNHATARYFMLYLQEQHQLKPLYKAFFNRKVSDEPERQAVELIESVLGRSLDQVDQDFARWFTSLPR